MTYSHGTHQDSNIKPMDQLETPTKFTLLSSRDHLTILNNYGAHKNSSKITHIQLK